MLGSQVQEDQVPPEAFRGQNDTRDPWWLLRLLAITVFHAQTAHAMGTSAD